MERKRRRLAMERKRGRLIEDDDSEFLLPPEIYIEILSRLPADSAIGCRGICKQWRSLIDDDYPSFVESHTRQVILSSSSSNPKRFGNYLIPKSSSSGLFLCAQQFNMDFRLHFKEYNDDDDLKVKSKLITGHPFPFYYSNWGNLLISSCNGLVFMGSTEPNYSNDMFVCNPFTREYVNLRTKPNAPTIKEERHKGPMTYGFGYLPSTNEYKIVSIYYPDRDGPDYIKWVKGKVSVYTLGSGRWRNKGEIPYWLHNVFHPGFFANGAIHWFNYPDKKIVTFNLADEEFRVVVPSPPPASSANYINELGVLGGCLCVTSDKTRYESPKHIWVLNVHTKEKGEEEFSWNKRFSIQWQGITSGVKPHVIFKSGKILLQGDGTGLICYDPKTGAFDEDKENISRDPLLKVIPYTKSFVFLKALGEEDAKCFGGFV